MVASSTSPLTASTVLAIGERIPVPEYDRASVTAGIVHFGVGNFHRAHQAMYLDRLMNAGEALDWGICGVGVLPSDIRMRDVLAAQNGLYTLTLKHADGTLEPRVIGSIVKYLFAPDDPEAVIHQLADPATRIVSLTVTEGGYNNHPVTGLFDAENAAIVADAHAAAPATVFGLVVEGLRRRRAAGTPPFTVMSCDNIQENGHVAKAAFVAFARIADPELADWMEENVSFPNSMVDRITPVTTDADRALVAEKFGIDDGWPVLSEPFEQWVLEDSFSLGRPPYADAGVQLVDDVMPYELMKLRLLNASHQALAYFGYLAGYRFAHEAMADPLVRTFLRAYMDEEGTPTLLPVPGIDLDGYKDELIERFSNPEVRDTLARLCADSSNRIPKWLVPVIRDNVASGGSVRLAAAIVASWARYAEGADESGEPIDVVDALAATLTPRALRYGDDELVFLRDPNLFGALIDDPRFVEAYRETLRMLHDEGSLATLHWVLGEAAPGPSKSSGS
jgi:mannitol 2-dehydrogenase